MFCPHAEEYEQRRLEEGEAAAAAPANDAPLPLFVMSLLLPGVHMGGCASCRPLVHACCTHHQTTALYASLPLTRSRHHPLPSQPSPHQTLSPPNPVPPNSTWLCPCAGEKMALNIFEPRYRLMVRRCMEGNRLFGMATVNRQHELCEVRAVDAVIYVPCGASAPHTLNARFAPLALPRTPNEHADCL